ncbi:MULTISPECIES: metallophosphoesterase [Rhizobium/Agrobacterium group]|uniref:metallophosphoesterase n=1 Tax=Rhizobium/Agrobacterium group TaxID=227290 RepID=UPI0002FB6E5B|nr:MULTISPECIES: metallophosphoesterase [Rhizobium/Agrobacterium group]
MKIIQITDTHLMPPGMVVNGVDPEKQLRAAVGDIVKKHADADLLVMTGDLCNYGDPEAYAIFWRQYRSTSA